MNLNSMRFKKNSLPGHHQRLLNQRMGVSDTTLKLLLRAEGLDLLLASEQVRIVEHEEAVPLPDGSSFTIIQEEIVQLYFPVPGYRGNPWAFL